MRVKVTPAPRTWWVNEGLWKKKAFVWLGGNWKSVFDYDGDFIRTAKPRNKKGWIKLKEVRPIRRKR